MNTVILMGRLTNDPEIKVGSSGKAIARYTLACKRTYKTKDEQDADFIFCKAFGAGASFAEKYLHKGTKVIVLGSIRTDSYKNKDGRTVYTTDVIVQNTEFCEGRSAQESEAHSSGPGSIDISEFVKIPEGIGDLTGDVDEELPWT